MKKYYIDILVLLFPVFFIACAKDAGREDSRQLTPTGVDAADPWFTRDTRGFPVLCWTENDGSDRGYLLKYAIYDPATATFGKPVPVSPSLGTRTSAESANKIAFKSDGTVVAAFGKRFQDPRNRFAGAIQFSLSKDDGRTWSAPRYLHSDTAHHYGRGFFDLATLPDGEVGAVWLDGRFGDASAGSALFFAKTAPGSGFGMDQLISDGTCECCRTDLLVDSSGVIHLAYRDILYPDDAPGKQVRDMVYTRSMDGGKTFLPVMRISVDNWEVDGCPHSGPSLAASARGVQAVWFTAGEGPRAWVPEQPAHSGPGVYHAELTTQSGEFGARRRISREARHPQLIQLPASGTALVWDEVRQDSSAILMLLNPGTEAPERKVVIDGPEPVHHPVVAALSARRALVAWVQETNGTPGIRYREVAW